MKKVRIYPFFMQDIPVLEERRIDESKRKGSFAVFLSQNTLLVSLYMESGGSVKSQ